MAVVKNEEIAPIRTSENELFKLATLILLGKFFSRCKLNQLIFCHFS